MPTQEGRGIRNLSRTAPLPVFLALCAGWSLLSQVPVVPGVRGPVLLGPDGFLSSLERPTIDARFAVRGEIPSPIKVAYVDVDPESIAALGNLPWNRMVFAQVVDALFRYGRIRAIGFDFVFSAAGIPNLGRKEAKEGTLALGRSIREHNAVVVAASYLSGLGGLKKRGGFPFLYDHRTNAYDTDLPELPEYPVVGPQWGRIGLIDVANDDVRSVPMFAPTEHQTYLAMALQLALLHYGLPLPAVSISERDIVLRGAGAEVARIPLLLRQLVEPNWFSPWIAEQNPREGVATVLECARAMTAGDAEAKRWAAEVFAKFHEAIVLVGPTDPLLKDMAYAPMNDRIVPRVSVHGNLLKTIVGGRYIKRPPAWMNALLIFGLGLSVAALAMVGQHRSRLVRSLSLLLALAYVIAAFALFAHYDLLLPIVAPVGAAVSCAFVGIAAKLGNEEKRRQRIKNLFGSYVSASVVDEIVEHDIVPQTGGAEVEVTAFFSDIASFTSLSEQLSPPALVELMCEYFAEGTKAITECGGTLDKYVGDAIIAMFGAPLQRHDHAAAACRAALGLQQAQRELRARWREAQRHFSPEVLHMRTRVGLNTGQAVVGNIGSELRFNYTMMGAAVNLAQRMESAASHYGCGILVSSATVAAALRDEPDLVFLEVDLVTFAGLASSVAVFELLGKGVEARSLYQPLLDEYAAARVLYREGRWNEAAEAFARAAAAGGVAQAKNPGAVMAARCRRYAAEGREHRAEFVMGKS